MPVRPKRPCAWLGCGRLTDARYCAEHEVAQQQKRKQQAQRYDKERGSAAQRGYDARWTAYSKAYRRANPLCVDCLARGILTSVERGGHVDHIVAVSGPDDPLFWDASNHQSLCGPCHSRKTAKEDFGFGNAKSKKPGKSCGIDGIPIDKNHHWK